MEGSKSYGKWRFAKGRIYPRRKEVRGERIISIFKVQAETQLNDLCEL